MSSDKSVIVVAAFGTRGDVLPILAVAHALCAQRGHHEVLFATHEQHRHLVKQRGDPPGLTFVGAPTDPIRADATAEAEYAALLAALATRRLGLVVFNLFSLGAWHIAEAFGVCSVALSPCLVPYEPPGGFAEAFRGAHPELHAALHAAPFGRLGWAELTTWMWPLFSKRWAAWRRRTLGLGQPPLYARGAAGEAVAPAPAALPLATPLLHAYSAAFLPPPGYWPASVKAIGFIRETTAAGATAGASPGAAEEAAQEKAVTGAAAGAWPSLSELLEGGPVYVGFGSCASLLPPEVRPPTELPWPSSAAPSRGETSH